MDIARACRSLRPQPKTLKSNIIFSVGEGEKLSEKIVRQVEAVFKPYFHFLHLNSKIALHTFLPYYLIFLFCLLVEYENLIMLFISNKVIRFKELADSHSIKV